MKQIYFFITFLFIATVFPACEDETALEKASPWSVDGITPQTYTVDKPGFKGLEYKVYVLEEGTGPELVHGQYVCFHSSAFTEEGIAFQTTIDSDPYCYNVNTGSLPIVGLEEGIMLTRKGAKYKFVFPPELAFGSEYQFGGLVPPNSTVVYDIEIVSVTK